ncbi:MAG: NAD-dependent epimerase/dehydratase family protein [Chloroflexi bacterium]|nr:NAD-dependent epimerase/dehydratase family protein [Chloroflexota bacterium]
MTKALITGGAGFIGSHVAEAMVREGKCVHILDDFSTGRVENLSGVSDKVTITSGSITDAQTLVTAVRGCETVIHLAAVASVKTSVDAPLFAHAVNVNGTLNVLEAARIAGVRRVVFASSAAVYGDHSELPLNETLAPRCLSPYAAQKLLGEAYCRAYHTSYGLPTVALRFFNVFGPRQDPNSPYSGVISVFASRMVRGEAPVIYGDGRQTRDFVYVEDVVQAILAACEDDRAVGQVVNVASGQQTSVLDLVGVLNECLGLDLGPSMAPARLGEVRFSQGCNELAGKVLGWRVRVPLSGGLSRLLRAEYDLDHCDGSRSRRDPRAVGP